MMRVLIYFQLLQGVYIPIQELERVIQAKGLPRKN